MSEKEPTQRTEQGHEIPVPKRKAWDRLLRKVATPKPTNGEQGQSEASK
jgi:hypothetical protein